MKLIDADALFINLDGMIEVSPTGYIHGDTVADMIGDAPTVEAEPVRHGKWIEYPIADGMNQCSECGVLRLGCSNYCPNCGARLKDE